MTHTCQLSSLYSSGQHVKKDILQNLCNSNSVLNGTVNGVALYTVHNHLYTQRLKYYNFRNQDRKL